MNIPKIIVFVDSPASEYQSSLVSNLIKGGYSPLVDSKNCYRDWFVRNMLGPHRLFQKQIYRVFTIDDWVAEDTLKPDVCIYYNNDSPINEEEFFGVCQYFKALMHGLKPDSVPEAYIEGPLKAVHDPPPLAETVTKADESYNFRAIFHETKDVMFYEVWKPHTDRPYTTYVFNFSQVGHLPFFTNLFVCSSWGVARSDITFLQQVWNHLRMVGDFDIEDLLRDRVERCTPGEGRVPEPEPDVYRRGIEEVMEHFQKRQEGRQVY